MITAKEASELTNKANVRLEEETSNKVNETLRNIEEAIFNHANAGYRSLCVPVDTYIVQGIENELVNLGYCVKEVYTLCNNCYFKISW